MVIILVIINVLIFAALSGLHFYWVFGGKWALSIALPDKPGGQQKVMIPGRLITFVVASGLLLFALLTLANLNFFDFINRKFINYSMLIIGVVFLLRFLGDFNYVGVTKKVRNTPFAEYDSKIYIPLCGVISLISFALYILN